jgi:hypothetical protein
MSRDLLCVERVRRELFHFPRGAHIVEPVVHWVAIQDRKPIGLHDGGHGQWLGVLDEPCEDLAYLACSDDAIVSEPIHQTADGLAGTMG